MVIKYLNGETFIKENSTYLDTNKYMSSFFYLDATLLVESDNKNYAIKVLSNDKQLLAMKVEPYFLMLFGDKECLEELFYYIKDNNLEIEGIYCNAEFGETLFDLTKRILNKEYKLNIGMDFMEARQVSEESSNEVEIPTLGDVDELYECSIHFIADCGLTDEVVKDKIIQNISLFRIIRKDGKIVAFCKKSPESDTSIRICEVYTRPEYRGQRYARKVVNYLKNEILKSGYIATLNVDQANPISNHLYQSLGFTKIFSRAIYLPKKD